MHSPETRLVMPDKLLHITADLLARSGSNPGEAELVARHLVDSDSVGYHSHGVRLLPVYMRTLESGWLKPNTSAELLTDNGSILAFDGGLGYGRRVVGTALEAAITRCRSLGVSIFSVSNAHHIGRAGAYGEIAAEAGLISIYFCNSVGHAPLVTPFGGQNARLSTNPMCFAIPTMDEDHYFLLDAEEARSYIKHLKASKPLQDDRPVAIPGERMRAARDLSQLEGVRIARHTLDSLIAEGARLGLSLSPEDFETDSSPLAECALGIDVEMGLRSHEQH